MSQITEWRYKAQIIASSKTLGESMHALFRAFPNDPLPEGGVFTEQLNGGAYAAELIVKQSFIDLAYDFIGGGYPESMTSAGYSAEQIDELRSQIHIDWYDLYPSGAERVEDANALDAFISAKGYQRA